MACASCGGSRASFTPVRTQVKAQPAYGVRLGAPKGSTVTNPNQPAPPPKTKRTQV